MELPGTGATDEQCLSFRRHAEIENAAKESRLQHGPPGVKPEFLFDRPPLHTHPGVRSFLTFFSKADCLPKFEPGLSRLYSLTPLPLS